MAPRSTKPEDAEVAPTAPTVRLERGAQLPITVTVLRCDGPYVQLDVLGTPVLVLATKVRKTLGIE